MNIELHSPDKVPTYQYSKDFLQKMLNHVAIGFFQYGKNTRKEADKGAKRRWLKRHDREIEAYNSTGNQEHLVNAANYLMLEYMNPEHPNAHFKHSSKSVTKQ